MVKFVTGSEDKFLEAKAVISELKREDFSLDEIQSLDAQEIIKHKLETAKKLQTGSLVVEDISLTIKSMGKLPGPFIKWFLKELGTDGIYRLAASTSDRHAIARCTLGLWHDEKVMFFDSYVEGTIVSPRGSKGFGWDPLFQPKGSEKTFAEMDPAEKQRYSMRTLAFEKLRDYLKGSTR